ncbi:hypothetical protein SETIT_4G237100v2 [Setaria italica]|uniref:Secreted protein n=1 Tax=Setaria italica TaxID=4555 RepID=A0A368QXL6_SETIT|nr:hypothetical protein SETIT_4G237100v2 [Setaria italica]
MGISRSSGLSLLFAVVRSAEPHHICGSRYAGAGLQFIRATGGRPGDLRARALWVWAADENEVSWSASAQRRARRRGRAVAYYRRQDTGDCRVATGGKESCTSARAWVSVGARQSCLSACLRLGSRRTAGSAGGLCAVSRCGVGSSVRHPPFCLARPLF